MKAVILAAGLGTRLRPITNEKPKSLVEVNNVPILENQINCLDRSDIEEIVVVTGYMHDRIRKFLDKQETSTDVTIVKNEDFSNTDNLYSFLLTEDQCKGEEFLLMNGDIFVQEEVFDRVIEKDGGCIACDFKSYDEEAMKVLGNRENLTEISKSVSEDDFLATSIDIYKFSKKQSDILYDIGSEIFDSEESQWTELAINQLLDEIKIKACDIESEPWAEIDNIDDLLYAEKIFSDITLEEYDRFILDLDGTVYLDDKEIDGSKEAINFLQKKGKEIKYMSNNSSSTNRKYQKKLQNIGIDARESDIIISTDMVITYLKDRDVDKAYLLGTKEMRNKFEKEGISHSENSDIVVVGFDKELTYKKARKACIKIQEGSDFLLAHKDLRCPTNNGFIPDAGAIGKLVSSTVEEKPKKVFGKPTDEMVEFLKSGEKTLVIGDRISTDIKLGNKMDADTLLVLSGDSTRLEVEKSQIKPDQVLQKLGEIKNI